MSPRAKPKASLSWRSDDADSISLPGYRLPSMGSDHPQRQRGPLDLNLLEEDLHLPSIHVAGSDPYDLDRDGDRVAFIGGEGRSPSQPCRT